MQLDKSMINNGLDTKYLREMAKRYVEALPRVHQVLAYRYVAEGGEEDPQEAQDMGFIEYLEYQIKESGDGEEKARGDQTVEGSSSGDPAEG